MPLPVELGSQISACSDSGFLSFPVSMLFEILYGRGGFTKRNGWWFVVSSEFFLNRDARGLETLKKLLPLCLGVGSG